MFESRVVRVFVSSTFQDMGAERDALARVAFPELRERCRQRGLALQDVDLRWGLTAEESESGGVVAICLDEIVRCDYFVGLLGERYGWTPPFASLPEAAPAAWVGRSITDLEIQSALGRSALADRAYFYLREREPESRSNDPRLLNLREQVRRQRQVRAYAEGGERLARAVVDDLWEAIERDFPMSRASVADLQQEAFADERRERFVGRGDLLRSLAERAAPVVFVRGEPGSGKSALLAALAAGAPRAVGVYPEASVETPDGTWLLRRIAQGLERIEAGASEAPAESFELAAHVADRLSDLGSRQSVLLVIDGLDQVSDLAFGWLPRSWPAGLRLVAATSGAPPAGFEGAETVDVAEWPLSGPERREIVVRTLAPYRKTLEEPLIGRLLAKADGGSPLYLQAACEELRLHGDFATLARRVEELPETAQAIFDEVLDRLEHDHAAAQPGEALPLLALARCGLREDGLLGLIAPAGLARMPMAHWAPLRAALGAFLMPGAAEGGRVAFNHRRFAGAVHRRYLAQWAAVVEGHRRLAAHFEAAHDREAAAYHLLQAGDHGALFALAEEGPGDGSTLAHALEAAIRIDDPARQAKYAIQRTRSVEAGRLGDPLAAAFSGNPAEASRLAAETHLDEDAWSLLVALAFDAEGRPSAARGQVRGLARSPEGQATPGDRLDGVLHLLLAYALRIEPEAGFAVCNRLLEPPDWAQVAWHAAVLLAPESIEAILAQVPAQASRPCAAALAARLLDRGADPGRLVERAGEAAAPWLAFVARRAIQLGRWDAARRLEAACPEAEAARRMADERAWALFHEGSWEDIEPDWDSLSRSFAYRDRVVELAIQHGRLDLAVAAVERESCPIGRALPLVLAGLVAAGQAGEAVALADTHPFAHEARRVLLRSLVLAGRPEWQALTWPEWPDETVSVHLVLSAALRETGRAQDAEEALDVAKSTVGSAESAAEVARHLLVEGRPEEAHPFVERALSESVDAAWGPAHRARLFVRLGRISEALAPGGDLPDPALVEEVVATGQERAFVEAGDRQRHTKLVIDALAESGRFEAAFAILSGGDDVCVRSGRANILDRMAQAGRADEAIRLAQRDDGTFLEPFLTTLIRLGRLDAAVSLAKGSGIHPSAVAPRVARVLAHRGQFARAEWLVAESPYPMAYADVLEAWHAVDQPGAVAALGRRLRASGDRLRNGLGDPYAYARLRALLEVAGAVPDIAPRGLDRGEALIRELPFGDLDRARALLELASWATRTGQRGRARSALRLSVSAARGEFAHIALFPALSAMVKIGFPDGEVEGVLDRLRELDPGGIGLASALKSLGREEEALATLAEDPSGLILLASGQADAGDVAFAERAARLALRLPAETGLGLEIGDPVRHRLPGIAAALAGRCAFGDEALRQASALEWEPYEQWLQGDLAVANARCGHAEAALTCLRRLSNKSGHGDAWDKVAWIWALAPDEAALRALWRAAPDRRRDHEFRGALATLLGRQGRLDEARETVEQALPWRPQAAAFLLGLALEHGRPDLVRTCLFWASERPAAAYTICGPLADHAPVCAEAMIDLLG